MSEPAPPRLYEVLSSALRASLPVALVTVVRSRTGGAQVGAKLLVEGSGGERVLGSLGQPDLDRVVANDARAALARGLSLTRHYGPAGEARRDEVEVFVESFAPPPRLVIFGAVDFTAALAGAGKLLGFQVTVCDARPVFATPQRFPAADEVVVEWPDRLLERLGPELGPRDAVCILTHDPKFDVPATMAALRSGAGYIGVMGSRRTHAERAERLKQAGAREDDLARLMSPIGLDIGARSPEETAVSICAEIIALRSGHDVPSLRNGSGPIHGEADAAALAVGR